MIRARSSWPFLRATGVVALAAFILVACGPGDNESDSSEVNILHVSYDIAREIYRNINEEFIPYYEKLTGVTVTIEQSHAGSSGQVRSVIDGVPADVVSMNQFLDIQLLYDASADRNSGPLINADWADEYPNNSSPYRSTMAFVVRKGNPKNIL